MSGQKRYLAFCEAYNLTPLPLSESNLCLFSAFLAHQGLQAQTVSSYLSALRHLQVSAGFSAPNRSDWPRLQYTLKGIQRSQAPIPKRRMPITSHIMAHLLSAWQSGIEDDYETRLLWAAACLAFFGFLRSGEFAAETSTTPPSIQVSDVSVDSRTAPSVVSIHLRKAKTDPFGRGITVYLGKTGRDLCPVAAILRLLGRTPTHQARCTSVCTQQRLPPTQKSVCHRGPQSPLCRALRFSSVLWTQFPRRCGHLCSSCRSTGSLDKNSGSMGILSVSYLHKDSKRISRSHLTTAGEHAQSTSYGRTSIWNLTTTVSDT